MTYPGTRISTLEEVFAFAECADPSHEILWNIESKINAQFPNQTRVVDDFVKEQHAIFSASAYRKSITVSCAVTHFLCYDRESRLTVTCGAASIKVSIGAH